MANVDSQAAGSDNASSASLPLLLFYGIVAAAIVIAVVLDLLSDITLTVRGDDFILLAVLYIVAQATERLVEPLMTNEKIAPQTDEVKADLGDAKTGLTVATSRGESAKAEAAKATVVAKQKDLTEKQQHRALVGWALSTSFALIVCGALSLGLIGSVSTGAPISGTWKYIFSAVDVVVTGFAVGAGTKPLHDLITRIEKSKEKADPATDPAVPATG
jgi:hypothetical protein